MKSSFDEFFSSVYGLRWPELKESLDRPVTKVGLDFSEQKVNGDQNTVSFQMSSNVDSTQLSVLKSSDSLSGVPSIYWLDASSLFPVLALNPASNSHADLCAAPGGKSLTTFLLNNMDFSGHFFDLSKDRVKRLRANFYDFLGVEKTEQQLAKTLDAAVIGRQSPEFYQTILLDAPCSGERHFLKDSGRVEEWKESYSKNLAKRQYALLCSALDATASGGRLVYSTCSLSPYENDEVIQRLLKRREGQFSVASPSEMKLSIGDQSLGEFTEQGVIILPDRSGYGPIYFSLLFKI